MKIIYTSKFYKEYKKLPREIKLSAEAAEKIFCKNPFDKILNTHKLRGRFKEFWSFSITYRYRIIFEFGDEKTIYFHSIGDHDVYQ